MGTSDDHGPGPRCINTLLKVPSQCSYIESRGFERHLGGSAGLVRVLHLRSDRGKLCDDRPRAAIL